MKSIGFVLAAAILVAPTAAFSHGGGLDGNGCHHNRKQGGYHCHRGELAGQSFSSRDEAEQALRNTAKPKEEKKDESPSSEE